MQMATIPRKLKVGDTVRIVAPALSLLIVSPDQVEQSVACLESLGLRVTFGKHVNESDRVSSSSIASRVEDLHDAFADPEVQAIITVIGGFNSNQLLSHLDYELIRKNPKIFCGYSDITALQNAFLAKADLVTYSGPAFVSFADKKSLDYTLTYFKRCLFEDGGFLVTPSEAWSDDAWYLDQENRTFVSNDGPWVIQPGETSGRIVGANLCTFNLLQGTPYMPDLAGSLLFLEDDSESTGAHFDRDLQSLCHQPGFAGVRGLVIGRFQVKSAIGKEMLAEIVRSKSELRGLPVIAGADFGHTFPMITFPVGGEAMIAGDAGSARIEIIRH